jgi:heme/copper-type cytochrome/quinol oxidase subunit 3
VIGDGTTEEIFFSVVPVHLLHVSFRIIPQLSNGVK